MRQILCYGDSNTWGSRPGGRHAAASRGRSAGPACCSASWATGYHVVEEGLGGRTTVYDDPLWPGRSGREFIAPALECHAPLDLVVLMLGTNDISYAHLSAADAADGAAELAHLVRRSEAGPQGPDGPGPQVLLVCPPPVGPFGTTGDPELWTGRGREVARAAAGVRARRLRAGRPWLDAGEVITTSPLDGWHLEASQHELLGVAVAARVRELLD